MNRYLKFIVGLFVWLCFLNAVRAADNVVITCGDDSHEVSKNLLIEYFPFFSGQFSIGPETDVIAWEKLGEVVKEGQIEQEAFNYPCTTFKYSDQFSLFTTR